MGADSAGSFDKFLFVLPANAANSYLSKRKELDASKKAWQVARIMGVAVMAQINKNIS